MLDFNSPEIQTAVFVIIGTVTSLLALGSLSAVGYFLVNAGRSR